MHTSYTHALTYYAGTMRFGTTQINKSLNMYKLCGLVAQHKSVPTKKADGLASNSQPGEVVSMWVVTCWCGQDAEVFTASKPNSKMADRLFSRWHPGLDFILRHQLFTEVLAMADAPAELDRSLFFKKLQDLPKEIDEWLESDTGTHSMWCVAMIKRIKIELENAGPIPNQPLVHRGYSCDICSMAPIVGVRFSCSACEV